MKGISELVGAILVIAIVIVIGTVISIWSTGFFQRSTMEASGCTTGANYIIESHTFNVMGNNVLRMKISNFGEESLYGFGVLLKNSTETQVYQPEDVDQGGISESSPLGRGESVYISINMTGNAKMAETVKEITVTNEACFDVAPILNIYRS